MKLPQWLSNLLDGSVEDRLDAMRAEERMLKSHIQKLRREHLAMCDQIKELEADILKGVRL